MFIDIHGHTMRFRDQRHRALTKMFSPDELLAEWPKWEIGRAVLLPLVHHEAALPIQSSEDIIDVANGYPDQFIAFCNLDPRFHYNTPEADFTPVLEHYKAMGCKGVGEMCASLWWDDPRMLNMLAHIEKSGLPLLFHVGKEAGTYGVVDDYRLSHLEIVLARFPKLQFIGHSMAIWAAISGDCTEANWLGYPTGPVTPGGRLVELLERYDNMWCDISAGSGNNGLTRDPDFGYAFMEQFQDRILWGSDLCWPEQEVPQTATLKNALTGGHISQQVFDKIAFQNATHLLGL
jgi:uncharacterized protein